MADKTKIEWTEATRVIDRAGRRVRLYHRINPARPGQQQRRLMLAQGLRWCRDCEAWIDAATVSNGLCKQHANDDYRRRYAADGQAIRERVYARKRNTQPVAPTLRADLMDLFGGRCAYCPNPATTIDHLVAVSKGGNSDRGNLVPACASCNSRKRARSLDAFLSASPLADAHLIINELVMLEVL
jgi:hypothetical protein